MFCLSWTVLYLFLKALNALINIVIIKENKFFRLPEVGYYYTVCVPKPVYPKTGIFRKITIFLCE